MGKVGLLGASGAIGRSIAAALSARGTQYRVIGRSRTSLEASFGHEVLAEIATWDPQVPESVRAACDGLESIVYLVGVDYTQFQLHPVLMQKALDGAIASGVKRMLLIGTVYPYGVPQTPRVREDHPRDPHTFKGRMRKAQEDLLLQADADGKIAGAVLRLPDFYGPGVEKSLLHGAFEGAKRGKAAQLIGRVDTPHEFVFVPDVGPIVVALLERPEAFGRIWHYGGPGTITQREFAERIFETVGAKARFQVLTPLMIRIVGLFNALVRELVEMEYLTRQPVILDDSALAKLLGPLPKTSYDEGIRRTLQAVA